MGSVSRQSGGAVVVFDDNELALLRQLPTLLANVGSVDTDPGAARLHPPAYQDDADAQTDYARFTDSELTDARSHDLAVFVDALPTGEEPVELTVEEVEVWARVVGDARLVVAARGGVTRDHEDLRNAGLSMFEMAVVDYLGMLQEELVTVLAEAQR